MGLKCESSCPPDCQDCVEELKARPVGSKVVSKVLYTCTILQFKISIELTKRD